jgi:hypothetical protein
MYVSGESRLSENNCKVLHVLSYGFVGESLGFVKDSFRRTYAQKSYIAKDGSVCVLVLMLCIIRSQLLVRLLGVLFVVGLHFIIVCIVSL